MVFKAEIGLIKESLECQAKKFNSSEVGNSSLQVFFLGGGLFVFSRGMMQKRFYSTKLICLSFLVTSE